MSSESTTDARNREPERRGAVAAIEGQLAAALEGAEDREVRYHLRQALQLVEVFDDPK